jgi:hypothetical protein
MDVVATNLTKQQLLVSLNITHRIRRVLAKIYTFSIKATMKGN